MNIRKLNEANIENLNYNPEASEYSGCSYHYEGFSIIQREAKTTPKKIGQFVTLWKRNVRGETCPLDINDEFDFVIIICEYEDSIGHFLFPKEILAQKGCISSKKLNGKRGFRVYPIWDSPTSKQAMTSQRWQLKYFRQTVDVDKLGIEYADTL